MPTYMTEGVVLRRIDYGEHDRILTVLTREGGKQGVIARGVRKPGSRLAMHTDLFTRSRLQLAKGRGELDVLAQAERLDSAPGNNPRQTTCAAICAEIADRVLESHDADGEIYELVIAALHDCYAPDRDPRAAMVWFARRMMDRLGYAPQLVNCAVCAKQLPEAPAVFSAVSGGLLCTDCAPADPRAVSCSVRAIKVLRVAAAGDSELFGRLRLDGETVAALEAVVEQELAFNLDRQLRSFAVLRALEQR